MDISGSYTLYKLRARVEAQLRHSLLPHEMPERELLTHQRDDVGTPRLNAASVSGLLTTG